MTKQKMEYVSAGNLFLIYFEDILDNFTRFKFLQETVYHYFGTFMTKQKMEYVSAGNLFLIYFEDILDNFSRFKFL